MNINPDKGDSKDLRNRAEQQHQWQLASAVPGPDFDSLTLLHELQVHQIELEMQNEELRRAHQDLEMIRARYADLYDFAPVGYFLLEMDGRILDANLTGAAMFGEPRRDLINRPFTFLIESPWRDEFHNFCNQLLKSNANLSREMSFVTANGSRIDARVDARCIGLEQAGSARFRVSLIDITAQKRSVEAADRFRTALKHAPIMMFNQDTSLRYTWMSGSMSEYETPPVIGMSDLEILGSVRALELVAVKRQVIETGKGIRRKIVLDLIEGERTFDIGIEPLFDSTGAVNGITSAVIDISEQIEHQRSLQSAYESLGMHSSKSDTDLLTVRKIAVDILSSRSGREALEEIATTARSLAHATYAAVCIIDPNGSGVQDLITSGISQKVRDAVAHLPDLHGMLGNLMQSNAIVRVDNLQASEMFTGFPPNHPIMTGFIGMALRSGDTALGCLYLTDRTDGGTFTDEDVEAVQILGDFAVLAIHNMNILTRQRHLIDGLIAAQEEERRNVAYELHDGLSQYVMAADSHFQMLEIALKNESAQMAEAELTKGLCLIQMAVKESRRLVNGLRALALDDMGPIGALEILFNEEAERAGWCQAEIVHNVAGMRFSENLEMAVFRVAQEALTNSRRHANTERVRLTMIYSQSDSGPGELTVEVRDWGVGIDESHIPDHTHIGLRGIKERVRLLDGVLSVGSKPGCGVTVRATFPVGGR